MIYQPLEILYAAQLNSSFAEKANVANPIFTGTVTVTGNLSVSNVSTLNFVTSNTITAGNSTVNVAISTGSIRIANSTVNTGIQLPNTVQYSAPNFFLHANGSWVSIDSGGLNSTNNQIIYNSSGLLVGTPGFTYQYTTGLLTVGSVNTATVNSTVVSTNQINLDGDLIISTGGGIQANGSVGTAGQVLKSDGTSVYWGTDNAGAGVNAAAQITWTNTTTFSNTLTISAISANGSTGSNGQVLTSNGTGTYWFTLPSANVSTSYDIGLSVEYVPDANETLGRFVAPRAFNVPTNANGSIAKADTAATANTYIIFKKNGTAFGNVSFAASNTSGTFLATNTTFTTGDVLTIVAAPTVDTTLAGVGITLAGLLIS